MEALLVAQLYGSGVPSRHHAADGHQTHVRALREGQASGLFHQRRPRERYGGSNGNGAREPSPTFLARLIE